MNNDNELSFLFLFFPLSSIKKSPYSFLSNKNVSYVNLEFNRIHTIPRQMFHPDVHTSIRELRLGHNRISNSILPETFLSLKVPLKLDLSYNELSTIEGKAFTTLDNKWREESEPLSLYLQHNKLSQIKNGGFSQEKFEVVDLSYNFLSSFTFDSFGKESLVGGVNVSHNVVEKIVGRSQRLMIKWLDASHNKLSYGGIQVQNICPTQLLDLSFNKIEKVDGAMFPFNCSIKVRCFFTLLFIESIAKLVGVRIAFPARERERVSSRK
jgi:Leucine-rich repeat (LRR) protein